jgi:hypothetical protein
MYVCTYLCIYGCIYECIYVCIYVCMYETCPESKDTKVLNMYNIFNLQK